MRIKDKTKKDRLFEVSLKVVLEHGFAGLTMSKVAIKAKIAIGTIYIYFKNKDDLLNQLYLKLYKESIDRFLDHYNSSEPFKIGLKTVWVNYLMHRIDHYEESIFLEQYYRSSCMNCNHKEMAEEMKKPIHNIIQRGKEEMLVKADIDNEMLFLGMLGFIRELADEHVTGVYHLNPEKIDQAFEMSWNMIRS